MNDIENTINDSESNIATGCESFVAGDITYSQYSTYTPRWSKSYVKSPERSSDGNMGNLNELYATFVVPRLTVTYDIMPIELYRATVKQDNTTNEFDVTYYDIVYQRNITAKMYYTTLADPDYITRVVTNDGENQVQIVGVKNFTIDLVGTKTINIKEFE